jgi:hypothetical protein
MLSQASKRPLRVVIFLLFCANALWQIRVHEGQAYLVPRGVKQAGERFQIAKDE